MIRDASIAELGAIRTLLARANDAPYDLARVAEEKCFGAGVAGAPKTRVFEEEGQLRGIAVTCGRTLRLIAVDREHRRRGIGTALLQGERVIGAEGGNYFTPGVYEHDRGSRAFFARHGYTEKRWTQNLITTWSAAAPAAALKAVTGATALQVLDFIEREFGPIWRFEASKAPTLFYVEENGEIAGFSAHDANNRGLGFFGPTGVAKIHRGRGLGKLLLQASLADLRARGYTEVVIPWTDAVDFYRKSCGAEVAHRFVTPVVDSAP